MENIELLRKSASLCERAKNISHPMLPAAIKSAIVGAAEIVHELVKREINRNGATE